MDKYLQTKKKAKYNRAELLAIERRLHDFYREIEPIIQERVKLASMFESITLHTDGRLEYHFPPKVKKLDDQYIELIVTMKRMFFQEQGPEVNNGRHTMATTPRPSDNGSQGT